jgi:U5 snRNP protein, DIM1 family
MSYMLPHLHTGWHVDQAIMSEDDRLVVIRFGRDYDQECMKQDEVLFKIAEVCKNFAVFYLVDIDEVPISTRCTNYTILSRSCSSSAINI